MTGVAVNVTEVPEQIFVALAATLTLTGKIGFTVIAIPLLVAGFPVAHGVAFEVSTTETISLLARVDVVNVLLFVPSFTPFTFHW